MPQQNEDKSQTSLAEIPEKYSQGELYQTNSYQESREKYGKKLQRIPQEFQDAWRDLVTKIQNRDLFARIEEVKRAADGGFYWRNIFDAYWSDIQFTWLNGAAPGNGGSNNQQSLTYPANIYQAEGRAFMKIVGHKPDIHVEAAGDSDTSYSVAEGANHLLELIEDENDMTSLAQDFARIAYTDGRYGIYTRWVTDGSRFGYYDQDEVDEVTEGIGEGSDNPPTKKPRQPRGGEVMSIYGVPWLKVPINMRGIHEFPYLMLSDEIDLSAAKSLYPHIAKKIKVGEPGPAEFMFDRTTRIALTQGLHLISQMAEAVDQLPTIQYVWCRPCMFAEIEDERIRNWFEDNYPDGGKVVFLGDAYAESCNESMDDHWVVGHAVRGHGQSTPAYGYSMLSIQDAFNDAFDLEMETHMRAIPAIYVDPQVFDLPAYTKERAMPGQRLPLKHDLDPNLNVQQKMVTEPQVQVSAQLIALRNDLLDKIPAVVTGISPAATGQADENNTTLGGISILRAASRGEAGTSFLGFIQCYSEACEQAIRIGAHYRLADADEDGTIQLQKKNKADVTVDLIGLRDGNFWCVTDTDQTYPSTFEEKQLSLAALSMAAANGDLQAKSMLEDPLNAHEISRLRGIPNLKSSNSNISRKVTSTIERLLNQKPLPIPEVVGALVQVAAAANAVGKPLPPMDDSVKYKMFKSTEQPGPLDNIALELTFFQDWIASPAGQRNRFSNATGFLNVELYAINLQQLAQQAAQSQAMQSIAPQAMIEKIKKTPPQKNPAEQITFNYKDFGPSGKAQAAAMLGIDAHADSAVEAVDEATTPPAPRKLKR